MNLSSKAEHALKGWVGIESWGSHHVLDDGRFYAFVRAYVGEHGTGAAESEIREFIRQYSSAAGTAYNEETVGEYSTKMALILDYLHNTGGYGT